jgi:pilus assembly protein CpaB
MKAARLAVLGIALAAGLGAALLAGRSGKTPAPQAVAVTAVPTIDVLVAAADVQMGNVLRAGDLRWQAWPRDASNGHYLDRASAPTAAEDYVGAIARTPFVTGEPIRADKVIRGAGSGFMSAILPAGMRAVSTEISPETGAGGFILPNDRVDVLLSRRLQTTGGRDEFSTETILTNVRVLAIDQAVEDKNGEKVVVGKTATLELSPANAEQIALGRQLGTISLALRALVDASPTGLEGASPDLKAQRGTGLTVVRFGVASQGGTR